MAEKFFHLKERGTTFSTEVLAGLTTFATMSYIIFVQPATLAIAGMDFGAVMTATCISAALGCILMGLLANLPVAQAPAMGHNFFFVFTVCGAVEAGGYGFTWQAGLGTILISGSLFALLSLFGMRDRVVQMMPNSLKYAIAAGIGLFIALIGLKWGGVVVSNPATIVSLGSFREGPAVLVMVSVLVTALLMTYRVRGAILLGIAFAAVCKLVRLYRYAQIPWSHLFKAGRTWRSFHEAGHIRGIRFFYTRSLRYHRHPDRRLLRRRADERQPPA